MAAQQMRRLRHFLWLVAALAIGADLAAVARADETRPQVGVRFEILAPTFKRNLPERAQAELALARRLAEQLAQRYRFASWKVPPEAAASALGALILRLEEQPGAPNPRIVVKWFGSFGPGATSVMELGLPPLEVYPPTDPNWDTNNRADFESRVSGRLFGVTMTDGFDDLLFSMFVRELPIASSVTAVPADKAIMMPLVWQDVLLSEESKVVVRISKSVGAATQRGTLLLGLITERPKDPGLGMVQGCIREATFAGRKLDPVDCWHPEIPEFLNGAQVRCFISEYHATEFAGTRDGLVIDPR